MIVAVHLLASLVLTAAPMPSAASARAVSDEAQVAEPLPRRGSLGLSFKPLPRKEAEKHGLKAGEGLIANAPTRGSAPRRWVSARATSS